MSRVDIAATLVSIDFPDAIWAQLDLLGEAIRITDVETVRLDAVYARDTPYKGLVAGLAHAQISSLKAIYFLLRAELVHQAASHVRLFSETLITQKYISLSPTDRADAFINYARIEAHDATEALLKWERDTAPSKHVAALEALLNDSQVEYERLRPAYQFLDRRKQIRVFRNWCNLSIADQAVACGHSYERLYRSVYTQMSAYVHGSAWSLRHLAAYSQKEYDSAVVRTDVTAVVTAAIAVWLEFTGLMAELTGARMIDDAAGVVDRAKVLADLASMS